MAQSFDSATAVSAASGAGTNIVVNAGDTLALAWGNGNTTNTMTACSATLGGQSMTQIGTLLSSSNVSAFFYLLNPPMGTQSLVFTQTGDSTMNGACALYKGTIASSWTPNYAQATTTTANLTTTVLNVGSATSWLVAMFRHSGAALTAGTGTVSRFETAGITLADSNSAPGTGNRSLVFTNVSQDFEYTVIEIPIATNVNNDLLMMFR